MRRQIELMARRMGLQWRLVNWVAGYLRSDRERAEAIIETAFPGFCLRKQRSDKGKKKNREENKNE